MKTVFVLVGACFLALAAGLICHKSSNKYSHFWAGVCAVIGILLASATRLKNGLTYRIEANRPIPVL